jgi:hypothetical protein
MAGVNKSVCAGRRFTREAITAIMVSTRLCRGLSTHLTEQQWRQEPARYWAMNSSVICDTELEIHQMQLIVWNGNLYSALKATWLREREYLNADGKTALTEFTAQVTL